MGKTFCKKHEGFFEEEKGCEYCKPEPVKFLPAPEGLKAEAAIFEELRAKLGSDVLEASMEKPGDIIKAIPRADDGLVFRRCDRCRGLEYIGQPHRCLTEEQKLRAVTLQKVLAIEANPHLQNYFLSGVDHASPSPPDTVISCACGRWKFDRLSVEAHGPHRLAAVMRAQGSVHEPQQCRGGWDESSGRGVWRALPGARAWVINKAGLELRPTQRPLPDRLHLDHEGRRRYWGYPNNRATCDHKNRCTNEDRCADCGASGREILANLPNRNTGHLR